MDLKPENNLKRTLGLFPATNIVVANMIGAGIFTTSGLLMEGVDNPLLIIVLWFAGGLIALCGAISYSELGAAMPEAGGEYVFLSRLYHPLFGFLSGWVSFIVGFSAAIAASAIGFGEYFARAFPHIFEWGNYMVPANYEIQKKILAILVILLFTFIHLRGIIFGTRIQNLLTLLKIAMIIGLLLAGFLSGKGDFSHFSQGQSFNFNFAGWKTIGLSLMWIMFAYSGWNASTYIGSEIRNPKRNIPLSLLAGTGIVMLIYLLLNLLYIYAIPPENMKGVISIGGLAAGKLFNPSMETFFSLLISFALFSSLSVFIILGPRVYFAMAKDGYFFRFVSKVSSSTQVPSMSIILQCIIAVFMVLSGTFDQILTYMGFSLGIFPILAVLGVFKLRISQKSEYKLPGFPLIPSVYILAGIIMLVLTCFERPLESSIAICTVIAGIPAFFIFKFYNK